MNHVGSQLRVDNVDGTAHSFPQLDLTARGIDVEKRVIIRRANIE